MMPPDRVTEAGKASSEPLGSAPSAPEHHPIFRGMSPFEAAMYRVAVLDLGEDGSGSTPFILATADLSLAARRDLLIKASAALLGYCDRHGASECLKYALGLEHAKPTEELDQLIEHGLKLISRSASNDQEVDDDEDDCSAEDAARLIEEVHRTPRSSGTT